MEKKDFILLLDSVRSNCNKLLSERSVSGCSSLYGFLMSARMALDLAVLHIDEFNSPEDED